MFINVSSFCLYYFGLGPTNILGDGSTGSPEITDWELADSVPIEWLRTR